MNQSRKNVVTADNIIESAFLIPRAEMDKLSYHFGLPSSDREKLVQKMKDILGTLQWTVGASEFVHPETGTRYKFDNIGFHYEWGLSDTQMDTLHKYQAATCVVEFESGTPLEYWIRRLPDGMHFYLLTDYKTGTSHQTPRIKNELEQMLMINKQSTQIKDILAQNKANIEEDAKEVFTEEASAPPLDPGAKVIDLDF